MSVSTGVNALMHPPPSKFAEIVVSTRATKFGHVYFHYLIANLDYLQGGAFRGKMKVKFSLIRQR